MGRSVSVPISAALVCYVPLDADASFYHKVIHPLRNALVRKFDDVLLVDRWIGRGDHVIADSRYAEFGISENNGLLAVWVIPANSLIAHEWVEAVQKPLLEVVIDTFGSVFCRTLDSGYQKEEV